MEKKLIYMDNAATTPVKPEVLDAMLPYFTEKFGNPSSIYSISSENKKAITDAREVIAKTINTTPENIYFTAGGSESDNWALKATADAYASKGKHIITTKIEHHAILHTCEYLETKGFEITYLDVDENGLVKLDELTAAIRPDTILISVMFANNEIGTIEPIAEIGKIAHEHGVLFHTDAVQAYTQVPIDVEAMNIDMMSTSGHKINGPKGIGFLYIRKGVKIKSFIRRSTGAPQKSRYRERNRYHRSCKGSRDRYGRHEGAHCGGDQSQRSFDRAHREGDSVCKVKRRPCEASAEQRELQLPVRRGRVHADSSGFQGNLRIKRFCMYIRFPGSVPCTSGNRTAA